MTTLFDLKIDVDLSEFDTLVTDGGDLYYDTPGLAGSAGKAAFNIDDQSLLYAQKNISIATPGAMAYRLYLDTNSLTMATGDEFTICWLRLSGSPWYLANINLNYDGINYRLRANLNVESGNGWTNYYTITDGEHYIEQRVQRSTSTSSNDAENKLYIDGVAVETKTGLDCYDNWPLISSLRPTAEALDTGTSGIFFLDEIVCTDNGDYIGAAQQPPALQPVTLRRLVYFNYSYLINFAFGIGSGVYTLSETTAQMCLSLLSTFPTWRDYWVGYDGFDWDSDIFEDIVAQAIGELIQD